MSTITPGDLVFWIDYAGKYRDGIVLWEYPAGAFAVKEGPMAEPQIWPGAILTVVDE